MLLITAILYAPGIIVYALGKKEKNLKIFEKSYELVLAIIIVVLAVVSLVMIGNGSIVPF